MPTTPELERVAALGAAAEVVIDRVRYRLVPVMHAVADAAGELGAALALLNGQHDAALLAYERGRVGGNLTTALREPDLWTSVACSAWLHPACTSTSVGCTCPCHRERP